MGCQSTGAVGKMKTRGLEKIVERIEGEFSVEPFGPELIQLLKKSYLESENVQTACFKLVESPFSEYGLVVLIPDNANLKKLMLSIFEDDLFRQGPFNILQQPLHQLSQNYKIQAPPREINLFYLKDGLRGRIERMERTIYSSRFQTKFFGS